MSPTKFSDQFLQKGKIIDIHKAIERRPIFHIPDTIGQFPNIIFKSDSFEWFMWTSKGILWNIIYEVCVLFRSFLHNISVLFAFFVCR